MTYNLALSYYEQGKLEEAVASYQKALNLKPAYAEAHNNLGNALQVLGEFEDSVASYRKAVNYKPDYAMAHNNLGNALRRLDKLEEAVAKLSQGACSQYGPRQGALQPWRSATRPSV